MASGKDVLKTISEKKVKFVDFRFCDTRGKEQHVTVPASTVDESLFVDGKMQVEQLGEFCCASRPLRDRA